MAAAVILDFKIFNGPTRQEGRTTSLCQISTKSLQFWPTYGDFLLFKMAAAAIFDFRNFKFLTVGTVKRVELHQCAKFRSNRPNSGRDIAIFRRNVQECQTASLCQISSKSLETRPRYVSFNIMLVWLENAYSRPILGVLGHK